MTLDIKPKLIIIGGPTGIGKTRLSLALAGAFDGCIVSADAMQIYRHMDIGTAKPTPEEMREAPHRMIDIADPDTPYDAARFCREAREAVAQVCEAGMVPLVVGGTGFYIRALLYGLLDAQAVDPVIVEQLQTQAAVDGAVSLHARLCSCDIEAAARIHPHDIYRVIRALAVYETTGKPMSALQDAHGFRQSPFDALKICLVDQREILYERINRRVDKMAADGLLDEVKNLLGMGYAENLRPMQAIGYRHMTDFIQGRINWADAIDLLKRDTRRFAKRQLTWFRKEPGMIWAAPEQETVIIGWVRKFLNSSGFTK